METNKLGWVIAIIFFLIIIGFLCYTFYFNNINQSYNQGVSDGQISVITSITQTKNIPFLKYNVETNTTSIEEINLNDICG